VEGTHCVGYEASPADRPGLGDTPAGARGGREGELAGYLDGRLPRESRAPAPGV
jgi:hypothetical protein